MKYLQTILWILFIVIILIIFKSWFSYSLISSGDFPFFGYSSNSLMLYAWGNVFIDELGGPSGSLLWAIMQFTIPDAILGNILNLQWSIIERITYLYPFLILSIFSSFYLAKKILNKGYILSSFIFLLNTYLLMVAGGGQITVMLAISISPLVLAVFLNLINRPILKNAIIAGLILALSLILDPRITYIVLTMIIIYCTFSLKMILKNFKKYLLSLITIISITILVNAFWLLPTLINYSNPLSQMGEAYTSIDAVKFFSFAKLENTIALLHPYWPENVFGKVGFMKPEYLVLPVLAYSSLLFIGLLKSSREKKYILYFALLGLIGAFLAKGANDPFGAIYVWMFNYVPGFILFRDPTKWYLLVIISYSILIPFTILKIYELLELKAKFSIHKLTLSNKNKIFNFQNLFLIFIILYLLLLIKPALVGQLGGTFKSTIIPIEYLKLEQFLRSQDNFSRTLWVPTVQRFGFYSADHPIISAQKLFNATSLQNLDKNIANNKELLDESSIEYVIVPYDNQGEIFLNDRKYDNDEYLKVVKNLDKIDFLKRDREFGKIILYKTSDFKDHLWCNCDSEIKYRYINPTKYAVNVENFKEGDRLIFSEKYDSKWIAQGNNFKINSVKYNDRFNSFYLPSGSYTFEVYYEPQKLVNVGIVISVITLFLVILVLITNIIKNHRGKL